MPLYVEKCGVSRRSFVYGRVFVMLMIMQYVMGSALIALALALVLLVLAQSGKDTSLSGSISGGSTDTYYGQNKGKSRDKIIAILTTVVAIVFTVLVVVSYVLIAKFY